MCIRDRSKATAGLSQITIPRRIKVMRGHRGSAKYRNRIFLDTAFSVPEDLMNPQGVLARTPRISLTKALRIANPMRSHTLIKPNKLRGILVP